MVNQASRWLITGICSFACMTTVSANSLQYQLEPQKLAENTYAFVGSTDDFTTENGGNIVNTGFIVTSEGVVVFDTGPSRRYGEAMRKAIAAVTDKPVKHVFNSHHHPDHFLGNQGFEGSKIWSLPKSGRLIARDGNAFAENMYRLTGDWMRGTEVVLPTDPLETTSMKVGGHELEFFSLHGHSDADLAMLDKTTGVLFASDVVFFQRALTTPHTPGLDVWLKDLKTLRGIDYKVLVPGHGPVVKDHKAIDQTIDYLSWLDKTLRTAAESGRTMSEVMKIPIPARFSDVNLAKEELARTVVHLYPDYEEAAF